MVILTLARRSLHRLLPMLLAVWGMLVGFQVIMVLVAVTFQASRSFDLLSILVPVSLQRSLGGGFLSLASFPGIVTFGYVHPVVVLTLVLFSAYIGTEPAGEVEAKLFDLELSRPITRRSIVWRTLLVAFAADALIVGGMVLGTFLMLWGFAPPDAAWPTPFVVASLALHLVLLAWGLAAAGLLAAGVTQRRASALGAIAVLTVALYMVNVVAEVWRPARYVRWLSPFFYFPGFSLAAGAAPRLRDLLSLAIPTLFLVALGFWRFERRDL